MEEHEGHLQDEKHNQYISADTVFEIEKLKKSLGINKPNSEMTDDEIRIIARTFGEREDDTFRCSHGRTVLLGPKGYQAMLAIVLYHFPRFYQKWKLSQWD